METLTRYDLLNRYMQAVRKYLPFGRQTLRQDDILKELSANILSQMEDKEEELGHSLTEGEQAAILKQHGHPMLVASRYSLQQYLIGPALFPAYWYVLKIALVLMVLINGVVNAVLFAVGTNSMGQMLKAWLQLPWIAVITFAWVTIVFAGLEFAVTRYNTQLKIFDSWNPSTLPRMQKSGTKPVPVNALMELAPGVVFLAWWLLLPHHPWMIFGSASRFLAYSTETHRFYLPILCLLVAQLGLDAGGLIYAREAWQKIGKGVAAKCVALIMFAVLLRARTFVRIPDAVGNVVGYQQLAHVLNTCMLIGLKIGAAVVALTLLLDIGRLVWGKMQHR
ncbi:MAG TPA: hypothetical protein VHX63_10605 [Acidobacteriaceae bacterium]|jgi:hypothetical protein|nr:hypothetical protein [Acidobacteriaceae bacterium]